MRARARLETSSVHFFILPPFFVAQNAGTCPLDNEERNNLPVTGSAGTKGLSPFRTTAWFVAERDGLPGLASGLDFYLKKLPD